MGDFPGPKAEGRSGQLRLIQSLAKLHMQSQEPELEKMGCWGGVRGDSSTPVTAPVPGGRERQLPPGFEFFEASKGLLVTISSSIKALMPEAEILSSLFPPLGRVACLKSVSWEWKAY